MLGRNGGRWPHNGEIDIVECVNGDPTVYMSLHSTKYHAANPQHPPEQPYHLDTDLSEEPIIAGLEWNVHDDKVDLTWWMTWFDRGSSSWKSDHTTKVLAK